MVLQLTTIHFLIDISDGIRRTNQRSFAVPTILAVLACLSTGAFQLTIGDTVKRSQPTISRLCRQVGTTLASRSINLPEGEEAPVVKQNFGNVAGFPNVLGVMDCTHVPIHKPSINPEDYIGRKGYPTINVQAICDHQFKIRSAVVKWPGRVHGARIWRQCGLKQRIEAGLQGFLLADSGYTCTRYMLTPYLNPQGPAQERYNVALCRTRVTVEQTFGILKQRFQVLRRQMHCKPNVACTHIKACMVLHNVGIDRHVIIPGSPVEDVDVAFHDVGGDDQQDGRSLRDYITRAYF